MLKKDVDVNSIKNVDFSESIAPIIVVSGLPRSGTSMMMNLLNAGGIDLVVDNIRKADTDNPKGYFEFEKVKQLQKDNTWMANAHNKAVKVISMLLNKLPNNYRYKVIFMERNIKEIMASQQKMLARLGNGPQNGTNDIELTKKFNIHLHWIKNWIKKQPHMDVLYVNYNQTIKNPNEVIRKITTFLPNTLNAKNMAFVVDQNLYRQKSQPN